MNKKITKLQKQIDKLEILKEKEEKKIKKTCKHTKTNITIDYMELGFWDGGDFEYRVHCNKCNSDLTDWWKYPSSYGELRLYKENFNKRNEWSPKSNFIVKSLISVE